MTHLAPGSGPKTLHPSFKHIYKQFDILKMIHMHVLWLLENGLKKACKMGHFVSVKHFHAWGTQRVGSGHFFQQNFQDTILAHSRAVFLEAVARRELAGNPACAPSQRTTSSHTDP
jgi:hypothetical protein